MLAAVRLAGAMDNQGGFSLGAPKGDTVKEWLAGCDSALQRARLGEDVKALADALAANSPERLHQIVAPARGWLNDDGADCKDKTDCY